MRLEELIIANNNWFGISKILIMGKNGHILKQVRDILLDEELSNLRVKYFDDETVYIDD